MTRLRPMLEIDGAHGCRWGLTIDFGMIVALHRMPGPPVPGRPEWAIMTHIPAKLAEYIDVFMAQNFALIARDGYIAPARVGSEASTGEPSEGPQTPVLAADVARDTDGNVTVFPRPLEPAAAQAGAIG